MEQEQDCPPRQWQNTFARTRYTNPTQQQQQPLIPPSTSLGGATSHDINSFTGLPSETTERVDRIQNLLSKKLGPEYLSSRKGAGNTQLTYIEGWRVINLANEVFGYNGWFTEIKQLEIDFIDFNPETSRFNIGVSAIVRVSLPDGASHEDVGYGKLENTKSKADGLDKCKKEAVTDALKRTLRNFGSLLGNCLYDKTYTAKVKNIKAPESKFDFSQLHRPADFVPPSRAANAAAPVVTDSAAAPTTTRPVPQPPPAAPARPPQAQQPQRAATTPQHHQQQQRSVPQQQQHHPRPQPPPPNPNVRAPTADLLGGVEDDSMFDQVDLNANMYDDGVSSTVADDSGFAEGGLELPEIKQGPPPGPGARHNPPPAAPHNNRNGPAAGGNPAQRPSPPHPRSAEEQEKARLAAQARLNESQALKRAHTTSGAGTTRQPLAQQQQQHQQRPQATTAAQMLANGNSTSSRPTDHNVARPVPNHPPLRPAQPPNRAKSLGASGGGGGPHTVIAGALPALSVGGEAGRSGVNGGAGAGSNGMRSASGGGGGGGGAGGPGFVSARGVKRQGDGLEGRAPLGELDPDHLAANLKRARDG